MKNNTLFIVMIVGAIIIFGTQAKTATLPSGEYRANADCSFITNVIDDGGYFYRNPGIGAWVSVQGIGFGYSGYQSFECDDSGAIVLNIYTPEGYEVCGRSDYSGRVYIDDGSPSSPFYTEGDMDAADAILTCDTCVPSCSGKECGSDGCGGSCGSCMAGETCQNGACETGMCWSFNSMIDELNAKWLNCQ